VTGTRTVTFVLNGTPSTSQDVSLTFISGIASYLLTDIADGTTGNQREDRVEPAQEADRPERNQWSDHCQLPEWQHACLAAILATAGQSGRRHAVNALDYSVLRGAWGTGAAGDINGDGYSDNADYLIMKANWCI